MLDKEGYTLSLSLSEYGIHIFLPRHQWLYERSTPPVVLISLSKVSLPEQTYNQIKLKNKLQVSA
jgi:hypothetical protein